MTGSIERDSRRVEVDALERRREAVRVALTPHLPVRDDVDPGPLHVGDRKPRRVVLGFLEVVLVDAPELSGPDPRRQPRPEPLAVDEPLGLGVAPHDGGHERCHGAEHIRDATAQRPR